MSGVETVHAPVEEFSPEQVAAVEGHARAYGRRHALDAAAVEEVLAMLLGSPEAEEQASGPVSGPAAARVVARRWKRDELLAEVDRARPWDEPGLVAERLGTTAGVIEKAARRAGRRDIALAFTAEAGREIRARRRARDGIGAER